MRFQWSWIKYVKSFSDFCDYLYLFWILEVKVRYKEWKFRRKIKKLKKQDHPAVKEAERILREDKNGG